MLPNVNMSRYVDSTIVVDEQQIMNYGLPFSGHQNTRHDTMKDNDKSLIIRFRTYNTVIFNSVFSKSHEQILSRVDLIISECMSIF